MTIRTMEETAKTLAIVALCLLIALAFSCSNRNYIRHWKAEKAKIEKK